MSRRGLESLRGPHQLALRESGWGIREGGWGYNALDDAFVVEEVVCFHLLESMVDGLLSKGTTNLFQCVERSA